MKKKVMRVKFSKKQLLIFAGVFAVIGGLLVWRIFAATPNASIEAESATLTGSVQKCPASTTDSSASGGKYIVLDATSCDGTTTPPATSDCLKRTSVNKLTSNVNGTWTGSPADGSTVDASSITISNEKTWLATPSSGKNVCWFGGELFDTIPDSQTGTLSGSGSGTAWGDIWHHNGGFTLKNNNDGWLFDSVTIHHTGDAFNISTTGDNFEIRNSHIYDIRDDCVQNDYYMNGYVHDNYFESCYSGFSSKADQNLSPEPDGTNKTWTISSNIVYMAPTVSVYKGDTPGTGHLIKWAQLNDGRGVPEKLVFKDNIIRVDLCPFKSGSSCSATYFPTNATYSGNKLYWGGSGSPPTELVNTIKSNGGSLITKAEWDAAVSAWKTAHPGVK